MRGVREGGATLGRQLHPVRRPAAHSVNNAVARESKKQIFHSYVDTHTRTLSCRKSRARRSTLETPARPSPCRWFGSAPVTRTPLSCILKINADATVR